jgi:hypothetical protein
MNHLLTGTALALTIIASTLLVMASQSPSGDYPKVVTPLRKSPTPSFCQPVHHGTFQLLCDVVPL